MKTRHARKIREAILRARRAWSSDFFWVITVANELQNEAFQRTLVNKWRREYGLK